MTLCLFDGPVRPRTNAPNQVLDEIGRSLTLVLFVLANRGSTPFNGWCSCKQQVHPVGVMQFRYRGTGERKVCL